MLWEVYLLTYLDMTMHSMPGHIKVSIQFVSQLHSSSLSKWQQLKNNYNSKRGTKDYKFKKLSLLSIYPDTRIPKLFFYFCLYL